MGTLNPTIPIPIPFKITLTITRVLMHRAALIPELPVRPTVYTGRTQNCPITCVSLGAQFMFDKFCSNRSTMPEENGKFWDYYYYISPCIFLYFCLLRRVA